MDVIAIILLLMAGTATFGAVVGIVVWAIKELRR